MNKADLRSQLKQLRSNLSASERHTLSQRICHTLENLDWNGIDTLHCFEPIMELSEVDISNFVDVLRKQHPSIQFYTSRRINEIWTIVSWQDHRPVTSIQFDAVVVPMLGFDTDRQRIGYGGGYYDRFLATQPQTQKIGVCFEAGKVASIPAEPHDVALDRIVTEKRIYVKE
jgi:5-formyltetrahydrofolate cyclo-ligase